MRRSIDLALDGDAQSENVMLGLTDVRTQFVEDADAFNNLLNDVIDLDGVTRERGYCGISWLSLGVTFVSKKRKKPLIAPLARHTRRSAMRQTHVQHTTCLWNDLARTRAVAGAAAARARAYKLLPVLILSF